MSQNTCTQCGKQFSTPPHIAKKYPNWQPKSCPDCFSKTSSKNTKTSHKRTPPPKNQQVLSPDEVLSRYSAGPTDGIFTDGACSGNPGPGGWGAVWVKGDEIVGQDHGGADETTNNRMELTALISGYSIIDPNVPITIYSDSRLCVQTINEWAAGWERRGWRRKDGPVKNLDLVQKAYELAKQHPKAKLTWIKAHDGSRWNEYADALANLYLTSQKRHG